MTRTLQQLFADVFGIFRVRSPKIEHAVLRYLSGREPIDWVPVIGARDRAALQKLLPEHGWGTSDNAVEQSIAAVRAGWGTIELFLARRNLHAALATLEQRDQHYLLRYSRVLAEVRSDNPCADRVPELPRSVRALLDDAGQVNRGPKERLHMSVAQLHWLLEEEGLSGDDARDMTLMLLLDFGNFQLFNSREAVNLEGAAAMLREHQELVRGLLDILPPWHADHVVEWAERSTQFARVAAPFLVHTTVDTESSWLRQRVMAVLHATPFEAYSDTVREVLRTCNTRHLPRVIAIVEQLPDSIAAAQALAAVRAATRGSARIRVLDAAIARMAAVSFAPLAAVHREPEPARPILDGPVSATMADALRLALENRRARALGTARKKRTAPEQYGWTPRMVAREELIASHCDDLLADLPGLLRALEGGSTVPAPMSMVLDDTLIGRLTELTVAQTIRLVTSREGIRWNSLRRLCPLQSVTAADIVNFAPALGLTTDEVARSVLFATFGDLSSKPFAVVRAEAMWPMLEAHPDALDGVLAIAAHGGGFSRHEAVHMAISLIETSPTPLPQFLPALNSIARARPSAVRDAARRALERHGVTSV
ncbi:hypothetical protein [Cryobacterium sp. BB307]|uniref:hypothetical protein n=1 Tax=Cryobacterium sp. BB307 TaxID=2716317 RepID=UPI001445C1BD|nr:hypothetical protein [Cryobacterium sp. BB307]